MFSLPVESAGVLMSRLRDKKGDTTAQQGRSERSFAGRGEGGLVSVCVCVCMCVCASSEV